MYKVVFKNIIDFLIALTAFILLSPLLLVVAIAIKIDSNGPIFFKQPRLGKNGSVFKIYKFRSMVADQSKFKKTTKIYENDPRITKVGRFIRKTSIDELPQLINIIKGEMSFIGPRPPLPHFPKEFDKYNEFEIQRFKVKPGISGLAVVRCREEHDWDKNIPVDVEYVNNISFLLDMKLFILSFGAFFKYDNIYRKENS